MSSRSTASKSIHGEYHIPTPRIDVTQNIIDHSLPEHFGACLIATAVRQYGGESIYISREVIRVVSMQHMTYS